MEMAIIKLSSKGQIVIPASWRKHLGLVEGDELLAIGNNDYLLLRKLDKSNLEEEFENIVKPIRRKIKKLGIKRNELRKAIQATRESS